MPEFYIGLMSGTSLDGVDGVLVQFPANPDTGTLKVLHHASRPFPAPLRQTFLDLNSAGANELHRSALAGNALALVYAQVVADLLQQSGCNAFQIKAIGAHGQTVRHRPQEFAGELAGLCGAPTATSHTASTGYTLQLNNPALLAELTGIDVVADFRNRDLAAGGQGAPLVPAFHQAVFGNPESAVAVLNIGGIANVTLLGPHSGQPEQSILGFDCGPGNALMDYWCQKHLGKPFDDAGQWAASGEVQPDLLAVLLSEPYFSKPPPKSTGRDLFNPAWLDTKLTAFGHVNPAKVQTTLLELTAKACATSTGSYQNNSKILMVCGGGALNTHLMTRLRAALPGLQVESTAAFGLPPLQVEAAAFAWLARKCVQRETGSLPKVTGAQGARILGGIYPA
jgi:anhydro-N-acetylmuramic acid kinase